MEAPDEEFIPEEEAEEGPAALKKLREKLKKAVEEKQEYLEGWQRSRADFANYKKEETAHHEQKELRLRAEFAEALIPALDSFEMAFKAKSFEDSSSEWKAGLMSVYRELVRSLERFGIKLYTPLGEKFDPSRHEAIRETKVFSKEEDHTVVSVERSGYAVVSPGQSGGEHVIRPAQVTIGNFNQ